MNEKILNEIKAHAAQEFGDGLSPRECCGLVIVEKGKEVYVPCRNSAADRFEQFRIHPEDYADAEDRGEVVCVVHSHPFAPATPSEADLIGCENSGLRWLIVSWPTGTVHEFEPSGYVPPLLGRKFVHGIFDCYSLIRDYYKQELNIELMDFERDAEWWNKGQNLYMDNFEKAGFSVVQGGVVAMKPHDVVLMQVHSPVVNHAGIYIGDNILMHHFMNRLSSRDVYGEAIRRLTVKVVRYKEFLDA